MKISISITYLKMFIFYLCVTYLHTLIKQLAFKYLNFFTNNVKSIYQHHVGCIESYPIRVCIKIET